MRMHQPTGIFLLLWPCLISLAMVNRGELDLALTFIFTIGSILMRSAGCIINDIVDYDIDHKVLRTKSRPIASGEITFPEALKLLMLLLGLSAILLLFLNKQAIIICLSSMILVVIYPFCKRFTYWPQLCLGLVFNIGVLVAWVTVRGSLSLPPIMLYIACVFWTIGYDTIYAHQDRLDDLKLGLKSTAIKFGNKTEKYLNWFYTITATLFIFAGSAAGLNYVFFAFAAIPIVMLYWQVITLSIDDSVNCSRRFKINIWVGAMMFLAVILTRWV